MIPAFFSSAGMILLECRESPAFARTPHSFHCTTFHSSKYLHAKGYHKIAPRAKTLSLATVYIDQLVDPI